jgi:uncharacterized membrane protein
MRVHFYVVIVANEFGLATSSFDAKHKVQFNSGTLRDRRLLDAQARLVLMAENNRFFVHQHISLTLVVLVMVMIVAVSMFATLYLVTARPISMIRHAYLYCISEGQLLSCNLYCTLDARLQE